MPLFCDWLSSKTNRAARHCLPLVCKLRCDYGNFPSMKTALGAISLCTQIPQNFFSKTLPISRCLLVKGKHNYKAECQFSVAMIVQSSNQAKSLMEFLVHSKGPYKLSNSAAWYQRHKDILKEGWKTYKFVYCYTKPNRTMYRDRQVLTETCLLKSHRIYLIIDTFLPYTNSY